MTSISKINPTDIKVETGPKVHRSPEVSIVIPAYNISPYITETLESVFAQTFSSYEVLLTNDGSNDTEDLEKAIESFRESIVYIRQPNGGASAARNTGVRLARGTLLAFLDGDDVWHPEFLASQVEFLKANDLDMVYADALFFGENAPANTSYMQLSKSEGEVTTESLIEWTCNVITSGTVVYRDHIVAAGFFDEAPNWKRAQDYEMWFRLARRGCKIGYQRKILLKYRVRVGSVSGNHLEQAERNIVALEGLKSKFEFTESEKAVWNKQIAVAQAMWEVESGKAALKDGNFSAARQHFARAVPIYSRPKTALLDLALRVTPRLVQRMVRGYDFER